MENLFFHYNFIQLNFTILSLLQKIFYLNLNYLNLFKFLSSIYIVILLSSNLKIFDDKHMHLYLYPFMLILLGKK